ncbi:MAG: 4Fe-4S binding protein [bacterium]|nr:4Fe-4S binding protein [bacterium]
MLAVRKIVQIDEEKCDGCGVCVPSCAEGAIQIIDGKAKVVDLSFCDGLGACLGECPQGAITIIESAAPAFDEEKVKHHFASQKKDREIPAPAPAPEPLACGCPGSAMRTIARGTPAVKPVPSATMESALTSWPVQLMLVPPIAPFLKNADLLISADCVPFAFPDFHKRFLDGRVVLVGCPKLDDIQHYRKKLEDIFKTAQPKSVIVLRMEVPCCTAIAMAAHEALIASGLDIPFESKIITIQGNVREDRYFA